MSWTITPTQPVPVDPVFNNVSLLLHGNGTNGSTTITDNSPTPKTVTAVGNAQISTAQSKFGGASIAFDGNGDAISTGSSTAFDLSNANWTIEFWHNSTSYSGANNVLVNVFNSNTDKIIIATIGTAGNIYYLLNGNVKIATSSTVATGQWSHIALVRAGAVTTLYRDGFSLGTTTDTPTSSSKLFEVGRDVAAFFHGYIDDLRITKGVARYTSNFTPPTLPFPDF